MRQGTNSGRCERTPKIAILFGLMFLSLPPNAFATQNQAKDADKTHYGRVVFGGYDIARVADVCFVFQASMSSNDFFTGLRRKDTPNGPIFLRDAERVDYFPEEVTLDIKAESANCKKTSLDTSNSPTPGDFVKSLHFQPEWKIGMELLPAELVSVETIDQGSPKPGRNVWHYSLKIKSKNVDITSHLVVNLLAQGDRRISRLSVSL